MKQYWQKAALKIDALTLRERVIVFALAAVVIVVAVNLLFLDRQFARQKQLSSQIQSDQLKIDQMRAEMQLTVSNRQDPDAASRERLKVVRQEAGRMQQALLNMQKGLVSPDKMTSLLEDILKRDGKLRLISLKTLPVTSLTEPSANKAPGAAAGPASNPPAKSQNPDVSASGTVYTHGVEIVVQGSYAQMLEYMKALESLPWQLFWGRAKLEVNDYPTATMSLTLYSLSLDRKWLNL